MTTHRCTRCHETFTPYCRVDPEQQVLRRDGPETFPLLYAARAWRRLGAREFFRCPLCGTPMMRRDPLPWNLYRRRDVQLGQEEVVIHLGAPDMRTECRLSFPRAGRVTFGTPADDDVVCRDCQVARGDRLARMDRLNEARYEELEAWRRETGRVAGVWVTFDSRPLEFTREDMIAFASWLLARRGRR